MKILLVFISALYVVHSFSVEQDKEASELLEEIAVRDAEPLQAEDAVEEESRSCKFPGDKCKDDCDCCGNDWAHCNMWGPCAHGTIRDCFRKQEKCKKKPKDCTRPSQNTRNG
uniref:Cystine knot toxin n=1 Tax=Dolomedes mizhoanus TaxID=1366394 RepID=S5MFF1_9ARAC|nr:cystine knot toxin [Dolomedes mizhoanus]